MVVPNRELVNTMLSFVTSTFSIPSTQNNTNMDMNIDTPSGRSVNSSANISRELSAHSSVSSISYIKKMKAQSDNPSWANQVEEQEMNHKDLLCFIQTQR